MSKETREYAKQLVSQMTLEEKMSQMVYQSPADRASWHSGIQLVE